MFTEGLGIQAQANQCILFPWPHDWLKDGHLTEADPGKMDFRTPIGNDEIPPILCLLGVVGWRQKIWSCHCYCWLLRKSTLGIKPEPRGAQSYRYCREIEQALWWHSEPLRPVQSLLWILLHESIFFPFLLFFKSSQSTSGFLHLATGYMLGMLWLQVTENSTVTKTNVGILFEQNKSKRWQSRTIHIAQQCHAHMRAHVKVMVSKSWIVPMSTAWFSYWATIIGDVTTRENWMKGTWGLLTILAAMYESVSISKV